MWLWDVQLSELGFRRRSSRYWQCERRFGLPGHAYLSLFTWAETRHPDGSRRSKRFVEICAFHVTFLIGFDHVHFYFHERDENVWEPGGHTSSPEIVRLNHDPGRLRTCADEITADFIRAMNGALLAREG
jgi:hypothetical protein